MMSGMRKAPPISISSPRETIASRPLAERVEDEQHGGGVVVDDGRVLGAGQLAEKAAHMIVALAAPAAREIELERDGAAHGRDRGLDRRLGEQRAAEIGVQHGAGQVEDRAQARRGVAPRAAASAAAATDVARRGDGACRSRARVAERRADRRRRRRCGRSARSPAAPASVRSTSIDRRQAAERSAVRCSARSRLNSRAGTG